MNAVVIDADGRYGDRTTSTNKYSHAGSGASREDSNHDSVEAAWDAAETLWASGQQRWVEVIDSNGKMWYRSGWYFPNGEGRIGYSTPQGVTARPATV